MYFFFFTVLPQGLAQEPLINESAKLVSKTDSTSEGTHNSQRQKSGICTYELNTVNTPEMVTTLLIREKYFLKIILHFVMERTLGSLLIRANNGH